MPLPFIIGLGVLGVGGLVKLAGKSEMDDAKEKIEEVNIRNENNVAYLESCQTETMQALDVLGKHEAEILRSFQEFADIFEKIHNRPKFKEIKIKDVTLPEFTPKQLTDAAANANTMLALAVSSGIGAGFFATTGWLTISAIPAIAPALLISGIIDIYKSTKLQDKADKAWNQMLENEEKINSICEYLVRLEKVAWRFDEALCKVNGVYQNHLSQLEEIVDDKCDYENFTHEEKLILENTVLLVGLLYEMCKVKLTKKAENENELNEIKEYAVNKQIVKSISVMQQIEAPKFCSECGAQSQIETTDKDVFEYSEENGEIILTGLKDKTLTEIVIPNCFTIIGSQAFNECINLKSIVIPDSVTKIRKGAFFGCRSLMSIMIPSSVMEIGDNAFSKCSGLTSIVIPKSITVIRRSAFAGCKNLTSIEIPNSVRQIEMSAFAGCTKLKGAVIPKSIRKIGDKAFSGCKNLSNIVIPNPNTKISENAFDDSTEIVYM